MIDEPTLIGGSRIRASGDIRGRQEETLVQSLEPDTSKGKGPISSQRHRTCPALEHPFSGNGDTDEPLPSPQLHPSMRLVFSLQGAVMQLPSLALMAIVNDHVAIQPAYLPAYSAVCFLPHSLKPLWATLSTLGAGSTSKENHNHMLLSTILVANGLTYLGTALWIPVGGVFECFVWGFLRGVTDAWSQFLMDQLRIRQAQRDSKNNSRCYEAVSSKFQSHAATYSSGGSLLASVASFAIFAWRQVHKHGEDSPLSSAVVFALLIGSAVICFAGAATMIHQLQSSKSAHIQPDEGGSDDAYAPILNGQLGQPQPKRTAGLFASGSLLSSQYDSLSPGHDDHQEYEPLVNTDSLAPTSYPSSSIHLSPGPHRRQSQTTIRDKSDIACLVLLQTLLVGGAVKHAVNSLNRGALAWAVAMIVLATCFIGAFLVSSCWVEHPQYEDGYLLTDTTAPRRNASATIPARRLGLYLMLRHSVPLADFLMYSYVYAVFGKDQPIFIQGLAICQSSASMFASWVYGRYLAVRFHAGWGIVGLIAALSILTSLVSLLDIIIVHATLSKEAVDPRSRLLVLSVGVLTSFMGQIGYMPSVVLATANVVTATDSKETAGTGTEGSSSIESMIPRDDEGNRYRYLDTVHDEGIQYATFVACIDFGAQLGDWISVPIIAALGITRENQWANLDKLIILCAMMRLASLAFLFIIRPPSATTVTLANESQMPDGLDVALRPLEPLKESLAYHCQRDHGLTVENFV